MRPLLALAACALVAWLWRRRCQGPPAPPVVRERPLASRNGHSPRLVWRDPYPDSLLEHDADWLRRRLEGWL